MAGSGPPPDPNSRRSQQRKLEWKRLPASGRPGDPPDWPLEAVPSAAHMNLWCELWSSPQAMAWEQLGWVRVVARYALHLIAAEAPDATAAALSEVRQLEDRLGLSPMAMQKLQWTIVHDAEPVIEGGASVLSLDELRDRYAS